MLGIAMHKVTADAGSGGQRLAMERGELDGDCGAWSSVPPEWISRKKVNPVVKFTPLPIPGLAADVPFVGDLTRSQEAKDVLNLLIAPDALGRPFIASRQVPANRLAVIRAAFDRAMKDPQFL